MNQIQPTHNEGRLKHASFLAQERPPVCSILLLICGLLLPLDDPATPDKIIPANEAHNHIGEKITAELTVKASKNNEKRQIVYLDSEEDYKSDTNLAIIIPHADLPKFQAAGIADPAAFYFEKKIHVTGTVIDEDDQTRIRVTDPNQILLIDPQSKQASAADLANQLTAIRDEFDAARQSLSEAMEKLPTDKEQMQYYSRHDPDVAAYARRMIDLASTDPTNPASRDAFLWVIHHPNLSDDAGPYGDEFARAALLLTRHFGNDSEAVRIGLGLDNVLTPRRDDLLFCFYASAKDHEPMGLARLALGGYLLRMADFAQGARKNLPRQTYRFEAYDENGDLREIELVEPDNRYAYRLQLAFRDPDALRAEGERLLEDVAANYGDVPALSHRGRLMQELLARPDPKWNGKPMDAETIDNIRKKYEHPKSLAELASARLDELHNLAIGSPAPEIVGVDFDGNPLKLSDHRGKVVLLVFWGTWCGPCMQEVPHEREQAERLKDQPFIILGVDCDEDPETARKVMKSEGITWPNWHDGAPGDGPIQTLYHVDSYPTTLLIDAQGLIRHKGLRSPHLGEAVDALLATQADTTKASD